MSIPSDCDFLYSLCPNIGDTVKCMRTFNNIPISNGGEWIIKRVICDTYYGVKPEYPNSHKGVKLQASRFWKIIKKGDTTMITSSRPVVTETITRERIVDGSYDRLIVRNSTIKTIDGKHTVYLDLSSQESPMDYNEIGKIINHLIHIREYLWKIERS